MTPLIYSQKSRQRGLRGRITLLVLGLVSVVLYRGFFWPGEEGNGGSRQLGEKNHDDDNVASICYGLDAKLTGDCKKLVRRGVTVRIAMLRCA
jgi:hypothetical protein